MMKNYIFRVLGLLLPVVMGVAACSEDETTPDVAPEFPTLVAAEVAAGDTYTFTIAPNTAWTLALTDASVGFFALLDGETEAYRMHGEAGTHEVRVRCSSLDEFDTARHCEVTLTLGTGTLQETRTILQLTRKPLGRYLTLCLAEFDAAEDDFRRDEEGAFVYQTTPATTMAYCYDSYNYTYRQRFVVDANFEWVFTETPAWFGTNEVTSGESGRTEIFARVNQRMHPFTDSTFRLGFLDVSNPNAPVEMTQQVEVSLPGCEDFCTVERIGSSVAFDAAGAYDNNGSLVETGVVGSFNAPLGAKLLLAAKVDGTYTFDAEATSWLTLTEHPEEDASAEYGIWSRAITLTAAANEEGAREAILVAVPQSVAKTLTDPATLLTEDGTALKEASYLASTLTQASGLPEDFIAIEAVDAGALQAWNITFEKLAEGSWPWMGSWASVPYAYKVNYTSTEAQGDFFIHVDYASYRIFGFDGEDEEYTDLESCWIALEEGPEEGSKRIRMRLGESYTAADGSTKIYENPLAGDGGENEATILFYDAEGVARAMVYCTLNEALTPGGDADNGTVSFADAEAAALAGVYLTPIATTDEDYDLEMSGLPQYRLIFTKAATIQLNVPTINYAFAYAEWLSVDPQMPEAPVSQITVTATEAGTAGATGNISIHAADFSQPARILAVYNPDYQAGPVVFADKAEAEALGAILYQMPATDDDYSYDLEYAGVPQMILKMKRAGTIRLKVPAYSFGWEYSGGWLSFTPNYEENTTEVAITMTSTGSTEQRSFLTLYKSMSSMDESSTAAQIKCILTNEE